MTNLVADIANQVLDAIGWFTDPALGDLQEGSREAQVILRAYGQCVRQMLRAAHWDFARVQADLTLLADATGQTPNVGTIVPQPYLYSYAYPNDCMKVRFVPWNLQQSGVFVPTGNIQPANPNSPLVGGLSGNPIGARLRPARFLLGVDKNNPPPPGANDWTVQGVSPIGRTAIFTNVKSATAVYTALMSYPSNWDSLFRAAVVAYIASEVALPIWTRKDAKMGLTIRAQQVAIAKDKILQARATNGNETWSNSDFTPDWMRFRRAEGDYGGWGERGGGAGSGIYWSGCDDCCGAGNTSSY